MGENPGKFEVSFMVNVHNGRQQQSGDKNSLNFFLSEH